MQTKTFKADTMIAAFQAIQKDLGPEAIVVSVRKVPAAPAWQVWKKPSVEVVAMGASPKKKLPKPNTDGANGSGSAATDQTTDPRAGHGVKASTDIKTQPKDQLPIVKAIGSPAAVDARLSAYGIGQKVNPLTEKPEAGLRPDSDSFPPLAQARLRMMSQGLDDKIIQRVIKACSESLNPIHLRDEDRVSHFLEKQLEADLRIQTPSATLANRIMCLVGPSGSGKTSSCAKLAAFFSKIMEKRVVWVCADTVRAGAIAEARMYTDALDIPLRIVYTPQDLTQVIAEEEDAEMILVDFPGCNPRNEARVVEMGGFLTAIDQRTTYLVAPATTKEADLVDLIAAFGPFNLKGLIFTKMDETSTYGNLYNIAWRSQIPLTFFSNGTRIMDDLFPGQEKDLVRAIFREGFAQ